MRLQPLSPFPLSLPSPPDGCRSPLLPAARTLLGRAVLPEAGRAAALAANDAWRSAEYRAMLGWVPLVAGMECAT